MAGPQHNMHLHRSAPRARMHLSCVLPLNADSWAHAAPSHLLPCADSAGGYPTRLDDLRLQLSMTKAACTERAHGGRLAGTCRPCQRGGEESGVWCVGLLPLARLITSVAAHYLTAPRSASRSVAPSSEPCILAPRYRPRQRHLGCPSVHGQVPPRSQDLWRRDVLRRRHEF